MHWCLLLIPALQTSVGAANPTVVTVSQTLADYTVATFSASVQQDVSSWIAFDKLALAGLQLLACRSTLESEVCF